MMKQVGEQPGLLNQLPGFKQMGMLQRLRGGQMGDMFDGMDEQGMGELMGMAGGGAKGAAPALSRAQLQARVDDKKKRRARAKLAAKSRKKNKKR